MNQSQAARAFTLIELLIVVAILSIFAASLLAVVTAPAQEQVFADIENQYESGAAILFTRVVEDAHACGRLAIPEEPRALAFLPRAGKEWASVYFIDDDGVLRYLAARQEEASEWLRSGDRPDRWELEGAALLEGAERLGAEPLQPEGLWRISLRASKRQLGRELRLDRHMDVSLGAAWNGGLQ